MTKFVLMNKNTPVALIDYNSEIHAIVSIDEMYDLDFAPFSVQNAKVNNKSYLKTMNEWFKGRGIPSWRDDLDSILTNLKISVPEELLDKAFGLSLSDQYWIKPVDMDISWAQINFFENDFDSADFENATFSSLRKQDNINFKTPNNTSDGMLKKAWVIRDDKRCLLKGGFKKSLQEPLNEVLASMVCSALSFDYVPYKVQEYRGSLVSSCECFLDTQTELISANDVFASEKKPNNMNDYNFYVSVLEKHGLLDAREQLENMLMLDYLLMNEDRHMRNFGVIRNVETLEWNRVAPIFDTGQAMNSQTELLIMNWNRGTGKLFTNTSFDFEKLLPLIQDVSRFDINKLMPVMVQWETLLRTWQPITGMEDKKIEALTNGLKIRIVDTPHV